MELYDNRESTNFGLIDELFSVEECEEIIENLSDNPEIPGKTIAGYCEEIRRSGISWFKELPKDYLERIKNSALDINKSLFGLDVNTENITGQYTNYRADSNDFYDWHADGPFGLADYRGYNSVPPSKQWRKLSVIVVLNDGFEGGSFSLVDPSKHIDTCIQTMNFDAGSMIVFPSFCQHKVHPVTKGIRKSLVFWLEGPRWK